MRLILIIGIGGFIGTVSRYFTTQWVHSIIITSFPAGTFLVNAIGCLLIGVFYGLSEKGGLLSAEWRMFLTIGFCGGFTTFSAFSNDNLSLLRDGEYFYMALYTSGSVFLGLIATWFGNALIRIIP